MDGKYMDGMKELLEYVSQDVLLKILESFSEATGLHAKIVDRNGCIQFPKDFQNNCRFCDVVLNDPVGRNKCMGSYARAGEQAAQFGEPYIFRCHAGLVAFAAPIIIEGNLLGSIICGQVLMWEPEDFFWEEIEEMTAGLNISREALISGGEELSVISSTKVQAAADLLFVVANHIMQTGIKDLQTRREIASRQTQLNEEIQQRKQLEKKLAEVDGRIYNHNSFQKEKELLGKIRLGDKNDAHRLLSELVAEMIEKHISNIKLFKVRVLELLVLFSRSAVEGGANPDELLNLNNQLLNTFSQTDELDELCNLMFSALEKTIDYVYKNENVNLRLMEVIDTATKFIRENYKNNINLNDVAKAAFISPYYLSHIFKEQLNCTVMNYLTRVRMEEAKKLLRNPKLSVINIAQKLGYKDATYFCRVFKKNEGVTPSTFKKQLM